jgi:hypothetical protein
MILNSEKGNWASQFLIDKGKVDYRVFPDYFDQK